MSLHGLHKESYCCMAYTKRVIVALCPTCTHASRLIFCREGLWPQNYRPHLWLPQNAHNPQMPIMLLWLMQSSYDAHLFQQPCMASSPLAQCQLQPMLSSSSLKRHKEDTILIGTRGLQSKELLKRKQSRFGHNALASKSNKPPKHMMSFLKQASQLWAQWA